MQTKFFVSLWQQKSRAVRTLLSSLTWTALELHKGLLPPLLIDLGLLEASLPTVQSAHRSARLHYSTFKAAPIKWSMWMANNKLSGYNYKPWSSLYFIHMWSSGVCVVTISLKCHFPDDEIHRVQNLKCKNNTSCQLGSTGDVLMHPFSTGTHTVVTQRCRHTYCSILLLSTSTGGVWLLKVTHAEAATQDTLTMETHNWPQAGDSFRAKVCCCFAFLCLARRLI